MLTPAFEVLQDDIFLTVVIKAPFTKVSETEIFIEECDFKFYSKPYFLRLNLPGKIIEDGRESANYEADKGTFTIKVPKETPGEMFDGLDMLTKLLAPKGQTSAHQPVIEVLGEESTLPSEVLPEEDIDWSVEQTAFTESDLPQDGYKYGFGCLRSGVFKRLQTELCEVVDIKDPDSVSPEDRRSQRLEQEDARFNDDHYLADLYQDDMVMELLKFNPPWNQNWKKLQKGGKKKDMVTLTEEEKEKMRKLPNKEYLIDSCQLPAVYFSLVDIIFAYVYSCRLSEGEHNVESGWTISKLSATLSWLEMFTSLRDVLVTCYRRCLCFPLFRHWGLLEAAKEDTYRILSLGRKEVLKCLLDIQSVLTDTDQRYILNDLYINDYCVWIQGVSNDKLESLASAVKKLNIRKSDVGFSLEELETAAKLTVEEEEAGGIVGELKKLTVSDNTATDSDDESTETDDEDTETDDEDTDSDDENTNSDDDKHKESGDKDTKDVKCSNQSSKSSSDQQTLISDQNTINQTAGTGCTATDTSDSNKMAAALDRDRDSSEIMQTHNGNNIGADSDTEKSQSSTTGLKQEGKIIDVVADIGQLKIASAETGLSE